MAGTSRPRRHRGRAPGCLVTLESLSAAIERARADGSASKTITKIARADLVVTDRHADRETTCPRTGKSRCSLPMENGREKSRNHAPCGPTTTSSSWVRYARARAAPGDPWLVALDRFATAARDGAVQPANVPPNVLISRSCVQEDACSNAASRRGLPSRAPKA